MGNFRNSAIVLLLFNRRKEVAILFSLTISSVVLVRRCQFPDCVASHGKIIDEG